MDRCAGFNQHWPRDHGIERSILSHRCEPLCVRALTQASTVGYEKRATVSRGHSICSLETRYSKPRHEEDVGAREEGDEAHAIDPIFAQRRPEAPTALAQEDIGAQEEGETTAAIE